MEKIAIMCDSMAEISQEEAAKLNIKVIPMPFMINGTEYLEGVSLDNDTFFKMLEEDATVSTSQPSTAYVASIWDELLEEYDTVLYIPMSSGLSKSCETAVVASKKPEFLDKVFVVDNKRISITQRQSVCDAIELRDLGYTAKEIHDILIEMMSNSDIYITLNTLKYLKKGGRITPAAAALGTMLKLKPILTIEGDKLDKFKMRNRTLENAMEIMMDAISDNINGYLKDIDNRTDNIRIAIAYSGTDTTMPLKYREMVKERFNVADVLINPLSLSVSCHIGDGALAIAVCKNILDKYKTR